MHLRECCTPLQSGWAVLQGSADEDVRRGDDREPLLSLSALRTSLLAASSTAQA